MPRLVVALFGPSGAGKTTIARQQTRLTVYDRDDPQWTSRGEKAFRDAIKTLARDPNAGAVVIRAGATSTARRRTLADIAATHAFLVMPTKDVCHHQAGHRRRQDVHTSHASIETWYAKFDHDDQLPMWPGSWEQALTHPPLPRITTPRSTGSTTARHSKHRGGRPQRRAKQRMHDMYGYTCHLCGHHGAGESDHLIPLAVWPDQPVDPTLWRPAHGTHYPCPVCGRRCNQQRGTKALGQVAPPLNTSRSW